MLTGFHNGITLFLPLQAQFKVLTRCRYSLFHRRLLRFHAVLKVMLDFIKDPGYPIDARPIMMPSTPYLLRYSIALGRYPHRRFQKQECVGEGCSSFRQSTTNRPHLYTSAYAYDREWRCLDSDILEALSHFNDVFAVLIPPNRVFTVTGLSTTLTISASS